MGAFHCDMLGPTDVEALVLERESQRVGAAIFYFLRKVGALCQIGRGFDEGWAEVYAGHAATVAGREIARRAAESRTNIDNAFVGMNVDRLSELDSGGEAVRVELVERRQVSR
jgi:hypothetical protein